MQTNGPMPRDMPKFDPRTNPFRSDLAAEYLREKVSAERYGSPTQKTVSVGSAPLRCAPDDAAALCTEILFGESVAIYDDKNGWAWLQAERDGYVGYAPSSSLGDPLEAATHTLTALRSYVFPEPDLKRPPIELLSMTAEVRICAQSGAYSELVGGGWTYTGHIASVGDFEEDHAAVASRFVGTPYLWGGKTSVGLDCSGLIQIALARCGLSVPRDTDMQEGAVGEVVDYRGDESVLTRGDIVFWPGHAGIWIDPERFVHANATDMMVAIVPLRAVAAFIEEATGDKIRAVRRPVLN